MRVYVDNSSPDGSGNAWLSPRSDLQDGIDQAEALRSALMLDEAEVWVRISAAPYKPMDDVLGNASPSDPRDRTFTIPPGIQVKGGFVGTETTDDERIVTNARFTVLSGDIANTPSDPTDDSYSVVLVPDSAAEVVRISYLDNCLVVHGNADGSGSLIGQDERSSGGGLYAVGTATEVRVVTFDGCTATSFGGGASFKGSGEKAIGVGLTRCTFNANSATRGGGLSLRTLGNIVDPVFTNTSWVYGCSFRFNTAADNEATGDLGNGGAVWLGLRDSRLNFANCVMSENVASNEGSAIFVTTESPIAVPPSPLRLHSSTIVRNRISGSNENPTGAGGYAVYYEAPSSGLSVLGPELIKNSIVYGNVDGVNQPFQVGPASVLTGTPPLVLIEYSNIQGGAPGVTNIDANPQFVSSTYFALQSTSPCIDVGTIQSGLVEDWGDVDDDGDRSEQLPLDFRVRTLTTPPADYLRLVNTRTDMGAFEFDN